MVELADLALWTPVNLNLTPSPTIDWCDLRGERFSDPFLEQTVERVFNGPAARPLVRTDLDALLALDREPSLEPSGFIFHLSRCGSTLLSRLLGAVPGTVAVNEPLPVNTLIQAPAALVDESVQVEVLRLLVRALGRVRFGDERRLVVKLSSWNVRRWELVRRAFPGVPAVWLQRAPVEVMASTLAAEPGWLRLRYAASQARDLFGLEPDEPGSTNAASFAVGALGALLDAAAAMDDVAVVDYRELPAAAWERVAPLFGIPFAAADVERMREQARYHAKATDARPFDAAADRGRVVPEPVRVAVAERLDPVYRTLDARRPGAHSPGR